LRPARQQQATALILSTAVDEAADLSGPPQRFHAVVDRHHDAVAAFLARRVGPDVAQDLTQEEIAHALDVPVGTVRSRIHRARRRLTAHLGDDR
jgi:DNA-directed RNA polymerase specialized sigma24 family protein